MSQSELNELKSLDIIFSLSSIIFGYTNSFLKRSLRYLNSSVNIFSLIVEAEEFFNIATERNEMGNKRWTIVFL